MLFPTPPPDPIFFTLGPLTIRWYGLLLAIAAILGYVLLIRLADQQRFSRQHIANLFLYSLLAGFIGARLYHVLNELPYYIDNPADIFMVWQGGLAFHGGLIGGMLAVFFYTRRHRLNTLAMADLLAPALALGQAIGRWGNYFNQELFGKPSDFPWAVPIDSSRIPLEYAGSTTFHPTFLYESLWSLLVCGLLVGLHRYQVTARRDRIRNGLIFFLYLGVIAIGRIATELLRIDQTPIVWGIRLPILVSGVLVVVSLAGIFGVTKQRLASHNR